MGFTKDHDRTATENGEEQSDFGLWDRVRCGDACAFEILFRRHLRAVSCHCRRRLSQGSAGEAAARCEDAVAETFLHAWRRRESITIEDSLLPWLLTTATHCCENITRAERRRTRLCLHIARQPEAWSAGDAPADAATAAELLTLARTVIDGLRPIDAHVADLCVLRGIPPAEAAVMMEISEPALRARLYRLRRLLRTELSVSEAALAWVATCVCSHGAAVPMWA